MKKNLKNLFDLTAKNAVIVGGASGTGKAIAMAFAEYGANIAIADINYLAAKETTKEINDSFGCDTRAYKSDVTIKLNVVSNIEQIISDFGSIDIFVHSAGINYRDFMILKRKIGIA